MSTSAALECVFPLTSEEPKHKFSHLQYVYHCVLKISRPQPKYHPAAALRGMLNIHLPENLTAGEFFSFLEENDNPEND